ncbi:MAG: glycine--tRNA ligase subunit beta [Steroidobacteraceae bacterium]
MSNVKNLLVELFVEELPPKALKTLGESFAGTLSDSLKTQGLLTTESKSTAFASPRRLAVQVSAVADKAADKAVQLKLMPVTVALDANGQATPALLKKLSALGLDAAVVPSLKRMPDGKAEALFMDSVVAGVTLADGLKKALDEALAKLPIPKVMSYQLADGWTSVNFVRPAHSLVALHGSEIVNIATLGLQAGRSTQGHRFEASKPLVEFKDADSYAAQLFSDGAVIASFAERRAEIFKQLQAAAAKEGLQPISDDALLDEVTALVERPNVLTCQFEKEFLSVPQECLILTMKANQKYFPLLDTQGQLTNKFLVVSNIKPADPSRVIQGNERVVRPRLADAKFFFDQDRKQTLESRLPRLDKVVYHNKLGTQSERIARVRKLARAIGEQLGNNTADKADRAAQLAKADLITDMVGEFPELQGIMGRYYALHDKEDAEVAQAILEQYLPRGAGDELPATQTGMALALADKLETLAGIFAAGEKPTGTKDPFGLRRAAIGALRIIIERQLSLNLVQLIEQAVNNQPVRQNNEIYDELYNYIAERLRGYYLEGGAVTTEMFDAVLANRPASLLDFDKRLNALKSFLKLSDAQSLAAANKRINNILKKNESEIPAGNEVVASHLSEAAERELFKQLQSAEQDTAPLFAKHNYQDALTRLAQLRGAVDAFFDGVMVMAEEVNVRNNRLALLSRLRGVFLQVADLSRLPG